MLSHLAKVIFNPVLLFISFVHVFIKDFLEDLVHIIQVIRYLSRLLLLKLKVIKEYEPCNEIAGASLKREHINSVV